MMSNRYKFLRYFAYVVEILVCFIIQQTPGLVPSIMGGRPIFLVSILVTIAIFEDELVGMSFGLFIGVLLDFGLFDVVGFHAIILGLIGYFVGVLSVNVIKNNFLTAFITITASNIVFYLLSFLFLYVLRGFGDNLYAFVNHYISRIVYSIVLSPLFYFFTKLIALHIRPSEE